MMSSFSTQGPKVKTPPPDVWDPSHTRALERNLEAEISFRTQDTKTDMFAIRDLHVCAMS